MLRGNMMSWGEVHPRGRRKRLVRATNIGSPAKRSAAGDERGANLVVRVLAALVLGQIAHAFQFREFSQQLLFDTVFQGDINH